MRIKFLQPFSDGNALVILLCFQAHHSRMQYGTQLGPSSGLLLPSHLILIVLHARLATCLNDVEVVYCLSMLAFPHFVSKYKALCKSCIDHNLVP